LLREYPLFRKCPAFALHKEAAFFEGVEDAFVNIAADHRETMPRVVAGRRRGVEAEAPLPAGDPKLVLTDAVYRDRLPGQRFDVVGRHLGAERTEALRPLMLFRIGGVAPRHASSLVEAKAPRQPTVLPR
jgi:hypothetical protein